MQHPIRFGGSLLEWQLCAKRMAVEVQKAYLVTLPAFLHQYIGFNNVLSTFCLIIDTK